MTRPGGGSSGFNDRDSGIHRRVTLQREDLDKPVLRLDDPASVPKGRSYFEVSLSLCAELFCNIVELLH